MSDEIRRCFGDGDTLMEAYHDQEWGAPVHDDRTLFEFLILEGFQAGLSWRTILHKRQNFRRAFDNFDPARIAGYTDRDRERLLADEGIIRNRLKIEAAMGNAKAYQDVVAEFGSFDKYIWSFTGGNPLDVPARATWRAVPTFTLEAETMSKDLKARGFGFVGPTICYAFMQAVGMVNDHLSSCPRYRELKSLH